MRELKDARLAIENIDRQMALLFEERMKCSYDIADYKKKNNIPIFDESREKELIERNEQFIEENTLKPYYRKFIRSVIDISKEYQIRLNGDDNI